MSELRIEYPKQRKSRLFMYYLRKILRLLFILAIITCPLVNYLTEGPAWCVVVIWAILFAWRMFLMPDIIEFTSIGSVFRVGTFAITETTLIGVILSPGWLGFVLPIIAFSTLIVSGFLFVLNIGKQQNNIMPLIWEIFFELVAFVVLFAEMPKLNWPTITMGGVAAFMAVTGLLIFHGAIWRELKKRFHTK